MQKKKIMSLQKAMIAKVQVYHIKKTLTPQQ